MATQTGTGSAATGVENHEPLQTRAIIGELAEAIQHEIDDLFADGVVSAREIVRGVLLAADQLLGVEELTVRARADLVHAGGLQVHEHAARHVLARARLAEESVESIIASTNRLVAWHLAVGLDAVLEAEKLPTRIADLDTGLAEVDADCFTHLVLRVSCKQSV